MKKNMSNSNLVKYIALSGNYSSRQGNPITRIIIHHMAGNLSLQTLGNVFASREASATYGIDVYGNIGRYLDESQRPWTTSSWEADKCAVTIEVADVDENWTISEASMQALINLCVDICQRNRIPYLNYTGNTSGNLHMHRWYASTTCPGDYLASKFPYIAEQVNARLGASVQPSGGATSGLDAYSDDQLADMVLRGDFGNGDDRRNALGSRYDAVQAVVNARLGKSSAPTYTDEQLADMVLQGKFGNGEDRKNALGSRYDAVQAIVNAKCGQSSSGLDAYSNEQLADMVIRGDFGNGDARRDALGSRYDAVQAIVNSRF